MPIEVLVLLGLILLNGVFAMSEIALVTARKGRLQALAADGGGIARVVFAIPRGNRQTNANLAAFEATFGAG